MTQGTISEAPARSKGASVIAPPIAIDARSSGGKEETLLAKFLHDPWLLGKLFVFALVAAPAIYAMAFGFANESFGVVIAIVPDMLAAILAVWGIMACVLYLDAEEEHHEEKRS